MPIVSDSTCSAASSNSVTFTDSKVVIVMVAMVAVRMLVLIVSLVVVIVVVVLETVSRCSRASVSLLPPATAARSVRI